jgi:hypothetical protein
MSTATIRITHPDGRIEERTLVPGSYDLGREAGQLVLPDPNVSARHARLEVQAGSVLLIDLGSSNGTYAPSGERLSAPHVLEPGQALRLGSTTLTLLSRAAPAVGGTQVLPQLGAAQPPAGALPSRESAPAYPGAPYPGALGAANYPGHAGAPNYPGHAGAPNYPGHAGAYGAPPEAVDLRRLADRWMIFAIASVFCGCGLPGIINIVLVSQAKGAIEQGDFAGARSKLGTVKLLCITGWCLVAATLVFMVVVYGGLFAAMLAGAGTTPRSPY